MSDTPQATSSGRWRRWMLRVALSLVGLVLLLLGLLAAVFYTEPGTRFAVTQGVSIYDGMIPGAARVRSVEGTLAGGATVRGVRLTDREARPLVTAGTLNLRVDPIALASLDVRPGTISLDDVRVHLIDATAGGFADLGPEGPQAPPEPSPHFGPDLPVSIVGAVEVTDAVVLRVTPGFEPVRWIEVPRLDVDVNASGLDASVAVEGRASMPDEDLHLYAFELDLGWSDPVATVRSLLVQSNAGTLRGKPAVVDLARESFSLGGLSLVADAGWLAERTGLPLDQDATVQIEGGGSVDGFSVDTWLNVPTRGSAAVAWGGALEPEATLRALVDVSLEEAVALKGALLPPVHITAAANVAGDVAVGGEASVEARCEGCVEDLGPLQVDATGFVGLQHQWGRVRAMVRAEGVDVQVSGLVLPGGLAGAQAQVEIEELEALAPLINRAAPGLDLAGGLRVDALCGAQVDAALGGCRTVANLQRGRPVESAYVDAFAWTPAEAKLGVAVNALRVDARDTRVRLVGPGAQLRLASHAADVERLALRVANATGEGVVSLRGRVALEEPRSLDASLRVRDLSLSALNAFVPSLKGKGVLSATVEAEGPFTAPNIVAQATGRSLALLGIEVGDLEASARYDRGQAFADVHVEGPDVGVLEVDARVPATLNLGTGNVALHGRREARVDATLSGVPLRTAGIFVPRLASLRGDMSSRLGLRGSLRAPVIDAEVTVVKGEFDGNRLPDVTVAAQYADALAGAELTATHPSAFEAVSVDAQVPVALNLPRGRVRWKQDEPHRVSLSIDGAQLDAIEAWVPAVVAKGTVDATVDVEGDMRQPEIHATVRARDVAYDGKPVGETSLAAHYGDEMVELQLHAAGPEVSGVGVVAEVPLTLVPATGELRWRSDESHRIRVSVNELLIEEAMRWVPPPEDAPNEPIALAGRLSAIAAWDGTPASPTLSADVEVDAARFGGRKLGRVELEASFADARAQADLLWKKTARHTARVRVDVPVDVDLRKGSVAWDKDGEHHVRVAVPRIDGELLEPFVDTGDLNAAAALHLVADGHPEAFLAGASLVGVVRSHGETHRIHADLDLDQDEQAVTVDLGLGGDDRDNWAHVEAKLQADVPALLRGADWKTTVFEATADIRDVDLRQISAFTPVAVQDVRGQLGVHAVVGGTLGDPRIDGNINLQGGEATVVAARQRFKDVELIASLTNERIEVTRLGMTSAGGRLQGSGAVSLSQGVGLAGRVDLRADRLPIRSPGLPRMTFTGNIGTKLDVGIESTRVDVEVAASRVDVYTSRIKAAAAIPTNDNVGFVDFDEAPPREVTFIPAETPPAKRDTHIKVRLVDPVQIIGPSVDMAWGGAIQADASAAGGASAEGALRARGGGFELLGNAFSIEQGEVTLPEDGTNVPFINLVAVTQVEDVQITASIRGALPKPELELSSTPSMSQSDIFTVLVTGSTDTQEADPDEVEAKAAGLLAAMSNPALQQQLNDTLKVDKIGVGFGDSTDQPILTVGKHVSKDVYAETEYHHNAPKNENRAELRVEYDFAPRWTLETFFGDAAAGGVDVFWGRAFDTGRNAAR